ncbi:MAG: CheB methylesterase domain-containing protein [Gemmataceae bacterium]
MLPHCHDAQVAAHSVLVIGASTGGPSAIRELLAELPRDFPAAVLIAQHLPPGFTQAFAAQLARVAPGPVREARTGDLLSSGVIFLALGGYHTSLRPDGRLAVVPVSAAALSPSVDVLMASVAERYGSQVHAVILSGMGSDGVAGLVAARAGAKTYAQDPKSCVIAGMPERVIARGAVAHIASPQEIGRLVACAFGGMVVRNSSHG